MIQIVKSVSDFKPHIAVCHMDINGGSANGENVSLVMKSKLSGDNITAVLKALGENTPTIEKATYRAIQGMLETGLREKLKKGDEYTYIWVRDFDESTAVFEYSTEDSYKDYSISYSVNENGVVLLGDDMQEVVQHQIYTSVSGDELILKGAEENPEGVVGSEITSEVEEGSNADTSDVNVIKGAEETMSKEKELTIEEIVKAARAEERASIEAENLAKELLDSTTAIVKGLSFVEETEVDTIVKGLIAAGEVSEVIVKALNDANTSVSEATAKVEAIEAEMVEVKKEFGNKEQQGVENTPENVSDDLVAIQKAALAKIKAAKNK